MSQQLKKKFQQLNKIATPYIVKYIGGLHSNAYNTKHWRITKNNDIFYQMLKDTSNLLYIDVAYFVEKSRVEEYKNKHGESRFVKHMQIIYFYNQKLWRVNINFPIYSSLKDSSIIDENVREVMIKRTCTRMNNQKHTLSNAMIQAFKSRRVGTKMFHQIVTKDVQNALYEQLLTPEYMEKQEREFQEWQQHTKAWCDAVYPKKK